MRRPAPPTLLVAALALGGGVSSVGWYAASRPVHGTRFDSCEIRGRSVLVLSYTFGAADRVETSFEETADGYVVGLAEHSSGGSVPAIALTGQATYSAFGGPRPVFYTDGTRLPCPVERP